MPTSQPPAPSTQPPASPPLILASGSPRRRELLTEAGYNFQIIPPAEDVECGVCSESGPAGLVAELAYRKAAAVRAQLLDQRDQPSLVISSQPPATQPPIILAADTVAECDGFILGKPRDEADARAMLEQLSGREHRVLTGVCLWPLNQHLPPNKCQSATAPLIRVAVTKLRMDKLSHDQLTDYINSGAWEGKAGAFGYQDRLGWVHVVEGSESNVVGLPLELLAEMLNEIESP